MSNSLTEPEMSHSEPGAKARILMLTPQLPFPPEQGTSLRNYNILRGLLQRYRVTLLSFVDAPPAEEALERLSDCDELITVPAPQRSMSTRLGRMISDGRPDMAHRLENSAFSKSLVKLLTEDGGDATQPALANYDIVQIEGIELAYVIDLVRKTSPESRIIFDDHNAEYVLQRRSYSADRRTPRRWLAALYSRVQASRLQNYERQVCNMADHVVAVSDTDRRNLLELDLRTPVSVIPNSIDVSEYASDGESGQEFDLVFVGKMDYRPNIDAVLWFTSEIWPQVQQARPDTKLAVVGKNPHSRLASLEGVTGVTITGRVEKVQPYLCGSRVFIMPFRVGGGTRLKLIEAMASSRAIVSTTVGAEGFALESGEQLLLADRPSEFAEAILALLDDEERRQRMGEQARRFAEQYDWRQVSPRFYKIIENLLAEGERSDR